MIEKNTLFVLPALGLLWATLASLPAHAAPDARPNIVFLMADDHQAQALGCMGNREILTPQIDRLAADGVVFERCYATSPLCMASRATVMTGMYEYKTGCNFETGKLAADDWHGLAYPVLLRASGYRTAFAGKWGFPLEVDDYQGDFDAWGGFVGASQGFYRTAKNPSLVEYAERYPHVTRALGAFGRDFIRESVESDRPFCLSISFKAPHKPHDEIDPADRGLYKDVEFSRPPNFGEQGAARLPLQPKLGRQYYQRDEWDDDHYQDHLRAYYRLISGVDTAVGMIREEIERQGVADNTVIIYTSDNGYFCGMHGLQGKVLPYEESARIPLIILDPRSPSAGHGLRSKSLVANIDFAATILQLAGLSHTPKVDGTSLVRVVNDPTQNVRDSLLLIQNWGWINSDHNKGLAVVTDDWKYINWCYADENLPPAEELFFLPDDPFEINNRIDDPAAATAKRRLQTVYDGFHAHWSVYCVNVPDYKRYRLIFDRHVPWQKKTYRTWVGEEAGPKRANWSELLKRQYEQLIEQEK